MDDRYLGRMLGEHAQPPAPSRESLRVIVERHRRWKARNLALMVAVALVGGAFAGRYVSRPAGTTAAADTGSLAAFDSQQIAALYASAPGDGQGSTPGSVPGQGAGQPGRPGGERRPAVLFDRVFVRTSDGIAIRAYTHRPPERPVCPEGQTCPTVPAQCIPSEVLVAELSNENAIGPLRQAPIFSEPGGSDVEVLYYGIFGGQERSPAQWVAVLTGPDVASVKATFADGSTDEMGPVDGYAVLAHGITLPDPPAAGSTQPATRPPLGGKIEWTSTSGGAIAAKDFAPGSVQPKRPDGCPEPPRPAGGGQPGGGQPGQPGAGGGQPGAGGGQPGAGGGQEPDGGAQQRGGRPGPGQAGQRGPQTQPGGGQR
ncbi:MAG: hypothetical protein ACRD0Q_00030 [Acidimicrobiales bacterium]